MILTSLILDTSLMGPEMLGSPGPPPAQILLVSRLYSESGPQRAVGAHGSLGADWLAVDAGRLGLWDRLMAQSGSGPEPEFQ